MREFATAIGRAGVAHAEDVQFKLGEDVLTAKAPTVGQLGLFFQNGREGGFRTVESLFCFMSDILDDADWRKVENHLRDGLDIAVINDIAVYLIGEWSGRPTPPSSDSSPTQNGTGRKSTGKRRAAG